MDPEATPTRRKRPNSDHEDAAPTPASLKKRRLDEVTAASPSTPKALSAIASAIGSVFGRSTKPTEPVTTNNSVPPASKPASSALPRPPLQLGPSTLSSRPAIKLSALRGTKYDTGEYKQPILAVPPPKHAPGRPKKTPSTHGKVGRPPGSGKGRGRKSKPQNTAETEETSSVDPLQEPQSDATTASPTKRILNPTPKGILTPTKRGRPRGRKSVTFGTGHEPTNGEVFFEDLPKVPSSKKQKGRQLAVYEPAADEIVCEICSKPDSKEPNQIILCDNCDFAVHQECYEVPEIPTGEWLCKSCAQEDILKTPKKATEADGAPATEAVDSAVPATTAEIPDIPNLDHHVRSLQRVLLDRCTGQRPIRFSGQEEAHEKVHQLVERTVAAGEGNSMLLIGARGCGKTTVSKLGFLK